MKTKNNKSVVRVKNKKSAVKSVAKGKKVAVKNGKRKLSVAAPSVGRPKTLIKFPSRGRFTVTSLFNIFKKRITKVTLSKRIHEALANKKIILDSRVILHKSGRGQPTHRFRVNPKLVAA